MNLARQLGWIAAGCTVAGVWSCGGPGNTGKTAPDPALVRDVPWLNGGVPVLDAGGGVVIPATPVYPPIGRGLPDPGSQRTDCAALAGYEFSTAWFDTFEPLMPDDPNETGVAGGWASYDDLTRNAFHVPGDATWYPGLKGTINAAWGLPAERMPGPSCDGQPNDWVLHFRGGLFRKWGGGISHAFTDPVGRYRATPGDPCPPDADFCPAPLAPGATTDSAGLPVTAPSGKDYQQPHDFFDVSAYEGLAFWARRGPEGQDRMLVILTDKFTSSRLARENQTFCRRVRECHTACLSGTPCAPDNAASPTPTYRCFDPAAGPLPVVAIDSLFDLMYPRCGPSACTSPATYLDFDFDGKACRPYSFPAADESGEYCWNEGDPPPPNRDERCQDGWQTSIALTPDWTFHAIPFARFAQAGFGKRAPYMDLKSLDTIAFGATAGQADVYFDNVTLYRRRR
jgi:hypothetical protein